MVGMEINAGQPFEFQGRTVTDLVSWLQSQDQNAHVVLKGGGTLVIRRLRNIDGGNLEVEAVAEAPKPRPKSKTERALERAQVSKTDSPAEAERVVRDAKAQQGPGGKDGLDLSDTSNQGKDQGGTVPGTGKTGSESGAKSRNK